MASKSKQRGFIEWLPAIASVTGSLLGRDGQEDTNDNNQQINNAQMAFNAEQAQKNREFNAAQAGLARDFNSAEAATTRGFNASEAAANRDFQAEMRRTQYQTAIGDLKAAGLNPMLAYRNGGAGTPPGSAASGGQASGTAASGSAASSGSMLRMENESAAGIQGALAAAQVAQMNSVTKVNEVEARKKEAEIPNVEADTNLKTLTAENVKQQLPKIVEEIKNIKMDTLEKEERVTLIRAQQQLTNVQKELATSQITNTQAETEVKRILVTLQKLAVPGATNEANFERAMGEGTGTGTKQLGGLLQIIKGVFGK